MTPQMVIYKKYFPTCLHEQVKDLNPKGEHRNWWCPTCNTRWFKGVERNPDEWDAWLEEGS